MLKTINPSCRFLSKSLATISLAGLALFSGAVSANDDIAELEAKLSGVWNEGIRSELTCDNKKYHHTFSLSPDRLVLIKRYLVPYEGNFGEVSEERYRVVYGDGKSLMLFREGESFELRDTGDKVIRQLILESDQTYAWRVYGMAREHRAASGGLRCSK